MRLPRRPTKRTEVDRAREMVEDSTRRLKAVWDNTKIHEEDDMVRRLSRQIAKMIDEELLASLK